MANGSKGKLFPLTEPGVVTNTSVSLTWDPIKQQLTVIVPDVAQVQGTTRGNINWPKMTAQNLSSFWGPTL